MGLVWKTAIYHLQHLLRRKMHEADKAQVIHKTNSICKLLTNWHVAKGAFAATFILNNKCVF